MLFKLVAKFNKKLLLDKIHIFLHGNERNVECLDFIKYS